MMTHSTGIERSRSDGDRSRFTDSPRFRKLVREGILILLLVAVLAAVGCGFAPVENAPLFAPALPYTGDPPVNTGGAIYHPGYSIALFEDVTAKQVGDILTILLRESTTASKKASTSTSKDTEVDNLNPTLFGRTPTRNGDPLLATSIDGTRANKGDGTSSQSNSLDGAITVSVVQVMANGNLIVRGEKWITLNQGEEYVQFSGIVRPTDIETDNTVTSDKVADARIIYSGRGAVADSNRQGWLTRFFNSSWMPF